MDFIKQQTLNDAVLYKLFVHAQSSGDRLTAAEISTLFSVEVSSKRVSLAVDHLKNSNYVSKYSSGSISIEAAGYERVENELADDSSVIYQYANFGDKWLGNQTLSNGGIPASDRIISKTDNQKEIDEIIGELSTIGVEIDQNNQVGSELGDEKELIKAEIDAVQELTKHDRFRLKSLLNLVLPALRYLSEKFSGAAIGEAAKRLIALLLGGL